MTVWPLGFTSLSAFNRACRVPTTLWRSCRCLPRRRRHTRCLSTIGGAGCRLSDGNIVLPRTSRKRIAQFPISPDIVEYRPIPNTPIPVSFEPYYSLGWPHQSGGWYLRWHGCWQRHSSGTHEVIESHGAWMNEWMNTRICLALAKQKSSEALAVEYMIFDF